jgi:ribosomal protein S18 acetylase RimI-like enzyme
MSDISNRIYEGEKDFQTILDLIARVRPQAYRNDYPGKTDLEENLASTIVRANTRLWFDKEQPIAWAYVDEYNNLGWELDPQYEDLLGAEVVKWGCTCIQKKLPGMGAGSLDASCREDYASRVSFLKQHGFQQLKDTTVYMMRPLCEPIPQSEVPAGFRVRPISGKQEAQAVAAMHRLAFDTEYMTTEHRLVIMSTSGYDPALDLLVLAPHGEIVANCMCSVNEQEKRGFTDPISTHPSYRRRGLARALLLTGLNLLKQRGMTSAHLGTSGNNIAMQKTAESAGFTIEYKTIWFSKEVN